MAVERSSELNQTTPLSLLALNSGRITRNYPRRSTWMLTNANFFPPSAQICSRIYEGDCIKHLKEGNIEKVNLTFFDPPYLQGKTYRFFDDNQSEVEYWSWIRAVVEGVFEATAEGGAIYFMHREKNAESVLRVLRKAGWTFQNLISWKKKTSAVPVASRFSKQYQIIAYALKGDKPRVFNKLRIDAPSPPEYKIERRNGVYLTDLWDDIRELTSGYFAGDEALRDNKGNRVHAQQSPISLLLRIILSSTLPGDRVFDPTAGTGTTLVVASQLRRCSVGVEIDPLYVELIRKRLAALRAADSITRYQNYYRFTHNLGDILAMLHKQRQTTKSTSVESPSDWRHLLQFMQFS